MVNFETYTRPGSLKVGHFRKWGHNLKLALDLNVLELMMMLPSWYYHVDWLGSLQWKAKKKKILAYLMVVLLENLLEGLVVF